MQKNAISLPELKALFLQRLNSLEVRAKSRIIMREEKDPNQPRIDAVRAAINVARNEDSLWDLNAAIQRLEKGMLTPQLAISKNGISTKTGQIIPFFDYILQEGMPQQFVPRALNFRDQMAEHGWRLFVDEGYVLAQGRLEWMLDVGHLTWTGGRQLATSQDSWGRRGQWSNYTYSCSVQMDDHQLGLDNKDSLLISNTLMRGASWVVKSMRLQMETRFKFDGFALELNEDCTQLHLQYYSERGHRLRATYDGQALHVPPQAWLPEY